MLEYCHEIGQCDLCCAPDAQEPRKSPGSGKKIGSDLARVRVTLGIDEGEEARVDRIAGGIGDGAEGEEGDAALVRKVGGEGRFHVDGEGAGFLVEGGLGGGGGDDVMSCVNVAFVEGEIAG